MKGRFRRRSDPASVGFRFITGRKALILVLLALAAHFAPQWLADLIGALALAR